MITVFEAAFEDRQVERIEEVLLDGAFERSRTEDGIETGVGESSVTVRWMFCLARRSMTRWSAFLHLHGSLCATSRRSFSSWVRISGASLISHSGVNWRLM